MTRDIDVMLAISATNAQPVLKLLKNKRITPLVDDPMEFIRRTHVLPSQTQDTYLRVDLSFTDSPYELQAIARGEDVVIDGTPVRFATAEDLVIHKIIAGRAIDHQDVLGILLKNPGLDLAYTRNWLGQFASALDKPLREDFEKLWDLSQK
ncbi:MAG: hypothetical protein IT443_07100 [Phycisphaeraceae bacterium]|nr:hypothetical protein [Phycisphaeraceae bacterium]